MEKSIVSVGKTTNEAIENGLKILKVSKDMVDVKVMENEDKRSFFSILAPRVVKVELTVKEGSKVKEENKHEQKVQKDHEIHEPRKLEASDEEIDNITNCINSFLIEFFKKQGREDVKFNINRDEYGLNVIINGDNINYLIGYRGETMNAMQTILTAIANNCSKDRIRVLIDIENYREKREKSLEDLAEKIARTVVKTRKSVTLEPMTPYERKIIHSKLQNSPNVKTFSTRIEPHRKVVVALK